MNPIGDSLTQLQLEFEERLRVMAKQQQEAVALAFATQRQQTSKQNNLVRQLSTAFMTEVSQWFTHKLQGQQEGAVRTNEEETLVQRVNQDDVVIVDAEYRVIEDDPQTGKTTTKEAKVWVS